MIIDMHAHIWNRDIESAASRGAVESCRRYGVSRLLVSGLIGGNNPNEDDIEASNDAVLRWSKLHPELIRGMVYLNPSHANSLDVMHKYLEHPEFVGVKLWVATLCTDPRVNPIIEEAIRMDVPVLLHAWLKKTGNIYNESTPMDVAELARRYPEAKLIMAHLGGNYYYGIKAVRDCPNVWVDNSGTPTEMGAMDYTLKHLGADRILYGTDHPGIPLNCRAQVEESNAVQEEKEKIYYKNALNLFKRLR